MISMPFVQLCAIILRPLPSGIHLLRFEMVSILKDLVRADREGNWQLHLQSIQSALPIFAGCDRTNYFRWASVYLEDMRRLQKDACAVYENFIAG